MDNVTVESTPLPRVTIQFCTQCKWLLRAAYFAQELLSTFSTSLGEVALQPSTGGAFVVHLYHASPQTSQDGAVNIQKHLLWDRKAEGGFPETKELKRRVRDVIDPQRDLGHVDGKKKTPAQAQDHSNVSLPSTSKPTPRALNRLQEQSTSNPVLSSERNFTPMDVDPNSRPASSSGGETPGKDVSSGEKIAISGDREDEGTTHCGPGSKCEDCD